MTGPEIAVVLAIAGTGTAAYGQYQQDKQSQSQAKAQSAWNLYNSKVEKRNADAQQKANLFTAGQQKKRSKALLAKQRAMIGASGVEMEGSPLLVAEDTAAELKKEEMNARMAGQRKVSEFESRSLLDVSKASAAKSAAAGFGRSAITGAGSTLLRGGANAAFMNEQLKDK